MPLPFLMVAADFPSPTTLQLRSGITIRSDARIAAKTYRMPMPEGSEVSGGEQIPVLTPALTIRGNGITVDFNGATLQGSSEYDPPDRRKGLGIEVFGNNVTIKNLHVHGYKVGLIARHCEGLRIVDSDFSYNWKQHLASTLEREDLSDWQSYHHNENDEWLRYGAGIYLSNCNGFEVRDVKVVGGQCGLMLNRCSRGKVWNNTFSFLSGIGLGLYRSSDNVVMHNRIDWCVRGFSYGVYNRGQDSAGMLVFEQSSRNAFAWNSVTHGGDGFFLWAGQTTMDSGMGGCDDNFVYHNDFSHAPTNGIEVTFSRNFLFDNKIFECWHGIWGGYSHDTNVIGNFFGYNANSIAIEHGRQNAIGRNLFYRDATGIDLWKNKTQDPNWGYPKHADTDSHDYRIFQNRFIDIPGFATRVRSTEGVRIEANLFDRVGRLVSGETSSRPSGVEFTRNRGRVERWEPILMPSPLSTKNEIRTLAFAVPPAATMKSSGIPVSSPIFNSRDYIGRFDLAWPTFPKRPDFDFPGRDPLVGGKMPFLAKGALRGQRYILVDEWGPYDFKRPILWPREKSGRSRRFEILGPKGTWSIASTEGVTHVSAHRGSVPGVVDVDFRRNAVGTTSLQLKYVGEETSDYRGVRTAKGTPILFGYSNFALPISWDVKFFSWSKSENGSEPHSAPFDYPGIVRASPIKEVLTDDLDYAGGALVAGLPSDHYATLANGTLSAPAGDYVIDLTTDDGARLYIDGRPVISDAWHYQGPTLYSKKVHLAGGSHTLRVEHFQIDGYAALKVGIRKARS